MDNNNWTGEFEPIAQWTLQLLICFQTWLVADVCDVTLILNSQTLGSGTPYNERFIYFFHPCTRS